MPHRVAALAALGVFTRAVWLFRIGVVDIGHLVRDPEDTARPAGRNAAQIQATRSG